MAHLLSKKRKNSKFMSSKLENVKHFETKVNETVLEWPKYPTGYKKIDFYELWNSTSIFL